MTSSFSKRLYHLIALGALMTASCRSNDCQLGCPDAYYHAVATQVEYPQLECDPSAAQPGQAPPQTLRSEQPVTDWPMTLDEAIHIALSNSTVIRQTNLQTPLRSTLDSTIYDIALDQTDPRAGQQAALAAFDAQFATSMIFMRNERTFNNLFFGGGVAGLRENTGDFDMSISKRVATGGQVALRHSTFFDETNSPINRFHNTYDSYFEAELRQPLLQGAGIAFNRIAGPNATPGNYNGIMIARVNTDLRLAEFEAQVIDLLSEVERSYWQLYFTYRDLDAKIAARDAALQTWRVVNAKLETGAADREQEALARQQYHGAQALVENALSGTATSGLTVSTSGGVYTAERRLRRLLGLTASDGRRIRPADEPPIGEAVFDWDSAIADALTHRVELRSQKWTIKRREMELLAARNFERMRLDFIGQFRRRGFGDDLFGRVDEENGSSFGDLITSDLQEWQLGLQLSTPIGNRIGHTAVRHAELQLARERAIYQDRELEISDNLAAAFVEVDRAYTVSRTNFNRRVAARERLAAVRDKYEVGNVLLEFVLEAQRQATEADSEFYRSVVDYNVAIMNLHKA
ncbi:MAG: TolC family protein, partial [Planctomycetales bacterium]|nr:TolC family protein [Planctomycetales bacterium]